jgi:hypothetical protein
VDVELKHPAGCGGNPEWHKEDGASGVEVTVESDNGTQDDKEMTMTLQEITKQLTEMVKSKETFREWLLTRPTDWECYEWHLTKNAIAYWLNDTVSNAKNGILIESLTRIIYVVVVDGQDNDVDFETIDMPEWAVAFQHQLYKRLKSKGAIAGTLSDCLGVLDSLQQ